MSQVSTAIQSRFNPESIAASASKLRLGKVNLSVGQKFLCIVGVCVSMLLVSTVYGIIQMSNIGKELAEIAENDIPLTAVVSKITIHQLEQAIYLERAIRFGEEMQTHPKAEGEFKKAVEVFDKYSAQVDAEIKDGEKLAAAAIATAHSPEAKKEFTHVLDVLKKVEHAHKSFEVHGHDVFRMLREHKLAEALKLAHKVEAEEEKLNHELEALTEELSKFTAASALTAEEHEKSAIKMMIGFGLGATVISFLLTFFMCRRIISRPLTEVSAALMALAGGDTSRTVEVRSGDEIGKVAEAFVTFREQTIENQRLREETETREKQAREEEAAREKKAQEEEAERERKAQEDQRQLMLKMSDDLESSVGGIAGAVASASTELKSTAESMSGMTEETSTQSTAVASAAEQTTSNVQTVASAAEQLASSVQEITRQIVKAQEVTVEAVQTGEKANATVQTMAEMSQKIGDVVELISDIAAQTNLLALNATIEAARAGEAGKGFAVVASEVKSLANQTAKATEEISEQIGQVQGVTTETVDAIEQMGAVMGNINEITASIASAMEEQGAATQEITRNAQEAAQGTQAVSSSIQQVETASRESGEAAESVLTASGELSRQAEDLQGQLGTFLSQLRAA
jgi:methyl-accepting chemotaxis protein